MKDSLINFLDNHGQKIEAHGGYILHYGDYYYWYGEDRRAHNYVRCYRSSDLQTWEDRGAVITTTTREEKRVASYELGLLNKQGTKINLERPKVIYNPLTHEFVMWMHYENGNDYLDARAAIATSKYPDRDFVYHGSFRPLGYMSRDCTLFVDEKKVYFISAARDNADLHIYLLSDDYLTIEALVNKLFIDQYREAPALFKKDGIYYLLTSYCTGWKPNQCQYATSTSMEGTWSELKMIGNANTYHSQPSFILAYRDTFYYVGDCWGGVDWEKDEDFDYRKSTYLTMEIIIEGQEIYFARDRGISMSEE